jgi:hypothetical protein
MTDGLEHSKVLVSVNDQERAAGTGWSCRDHSPLGL